MSADQLRRAADAAATTAKHEDYATGKEVGDATAALLRAVADYHRNGSEYDLIALLSAAGSLAAAYLGEEPQP